MPHYFATKVHGFDPARWGGLGFPRDAQLATTQTLLTRHPDNLVLHIATRGEDTAPDERGRVLGWARLSADAVATHDLVEPRLWETSVAKHGPDRWPNAIPYLEAWLFDHPPLEDEFLPRLTGYARAMGNGLIPLSEEEASPLVMRSMTAKEVYRHGDHLRRLQWNAARLAAPVDPHLFRPPMPPLGHILQERTDGQAYTYCAVLEGEAAAASFDAGREVGARAYKIGWSSDIEKRERNLNFGMPDCDRLRWRMQRLYPHASHGDARAMEESVHCELASLRGARAGSQEVFILPPGRMRSAWMTEIAARHPEFRIQ